MSVKSWFDKVKVAVAYQNKKNMAFWVYCNHKDKVCPLEDVAEYPNAKLEQQIRKSICAVKYCPEDWLGMYQRMPGVPLAKNAIILILVRQGAQIQSVLCMPQIVHILMQKRPIMPRLTPVIMQLGAFSALGQSKILSYFKFMIRFAYSPSFLL